MGDVLDMISRKPRKSDCQGEGEVVDLRSHFSNGPDTCERRASAASAMARLVREMRADFGDKFTMETLAGEVFVLKFGGKKP